MKRPHGHSHFLYTCTPVKSCTPKEKTTTKFGSIIIRMHIISMHNYIFRSKPAKCKSFHTCTCVLHHHQDPPQSLQVLTFLSGLDTSGSRATNGRRTSNILTTDKANYTAAIKIRKNIFQGHAFIQPIPKLTAHIERTPI